MSNSMIQFVIWFTISIGREGVQTVHFYFFDYWLGGVSKEKVPNSLFILVLFFASFTKFLDVVVSRDPSNVIKLPWQI